MFVIFVSKDNTLRFNLTILAFLLFGLASYSQETIFEEKTTVYVDEQSGGFNLHTNGFSLNYRYSKYNGAFNKIAYEIEFATLKHPKEIKTISPFEDDVKGYVFGKMNTFFTFRPSVGFHNIFVPKQSLRGVSITYLYHIGPSLGLAKPIYLNIREREQSNLNSVNIALRKYNPEIHQQGDIYGRASFFNGVGEMKFYPGIFSKFWLEFEYSTEKEIIHAIEVGLMADYFFEEIPILAFAENRSLFLNLYVGVLFGQRKTK